MRKSNKPSVKKNKPSVKKNKPSVKKNKPSVKKNKPSVKKNKPLVKKNKPSVKKNKPSVKNNKPSVKNNKPSVKKNKPLVKKNKPSVKNNKPSVKKNKPKKLFVKKEMTDEEIKKKEGDYFSDKSFLFIIDYDCDIYTIVNKKEKLLAKFRKNVISNSLTKTALENLKEASKKKHYNRGSAAGTIDLNKIPEYIKKKKFNRNNYSIDGYQSSRDGQFKKLAISNESQSNIIGFFDKPDRNPSTSNLPCRLTAFNHKQLDKFKKVEPFLERIDELFKELTPKFHKKQYKRAHKTKFVINKTAFSTVTINYNWRTALHKDSGDYEDGFGNLIVCEEGKYEGGYTGFPQYGVAFDVRNGDFLAMDVHEWHCNTSIKPKTKDYTRLSVVCYLRNNMIRCEGLDPSY